MAFDLSLFQNIDFSNSDNLIFLAVVLVIGLIVFVVSFLILKAILKAITRFITRILNIDRKTRFNKKESTDWLHKSEDKKVIQMAQTTKSEDTVKYKVAGGDFIQKTKTEKTEQKYKEASYQDKEKKDIADSLSKLKSDTDPSKDTLESRMPSRGGAESSEDQTINIPRSAKLSPEKLTYDKGIKNGNTASNTIPKLNQNIISAKDATKAGAQSMGGISGQSTDQKTITLDKVHSEKLTYEKDKKDVKVNSIDPSYQDKGKKDIAGLSKLRSDDIQVNSKMVSGLVGLKIPVGSTSVANHGGPQIQQMENPGLHSESFIYEKSNSGASRIGNQDGNKTVKVPTSKQNNSLQDGSIFHGGAEVTRIELEHEMKADTNVWKAAKQSGLNLSPMQRAKLVKEVFSANLGRNISKDDLKLTLNKLNKKLVTAKDSSEHTKLRKEIKFFKKIGGIK